MSTNNNAKYKCPFCTKIYTQKPSLYTHMEKEHEEQLEGLPAAQVYFNIKNHKTGGKCIICKQPTEFNLTKERYERLCNNPKCKEKYRQMFRERMIKKYGKDTLLNDPEQQKKMLANRKISGTYVWSTNKKFKFTYTGSYEKDFLEFMDIFLNWSPQDIYMPCPIIFKYQYKGKEHFYMPDAYIPSANACIEIKSYTNMHYRERDKEIEMTKDKVLENSNFNYIKVHDKYYDDFFYKLLEYVKKESKYSDK